MLEVVACIDICRDETARILKIEYWRPKAILKPAMTAVKTSLWCDQCILKYETHLTRRSTSVPTDTVHGDTLVSDQASGRIYTGCVHSKQVWIIRSSYQEPKSAKVYLGARAGYWERVKNDCSNRHFLKMSNNKLEKQKHDIGRGTTEK